MTEANKILLNNSRKQIIYYISRIIANSPIDKKKLEKLGAALITLQNNVFTQVIKNKDDKFIENISSDFMYLLDLISVYIADFNVMDANIPFEKRIEALRTNYMKDKCKEIYNIFKNA